MADVTINVKNEDGSLSTFQAPTDMGLSLMEFLKGNDYDIAATCGGMALCATCHVQVLEGSPPLPDPGDEEYAMLDTLPNITDHSRLSCQLRLTPEINGITVKVMGDGL
jgi:ferredoxin, 2Fe-2S